MLSAADNSVEGMTGSVRGRIALFVVGYLVLTAAVSVIAFFHLRYGHCGELSSPGSCDFIRGAGTPLLLFGPAAVVAVASILALRSRRPLFVPLPVAVVVAAIIIIDATTIA